MSINKNSLYSRQIGVIGRDTMVKLSNLKVFIFDLDTVGIEIAKCLCLLGIKKLYINDSRKITDINKGRNYAIESTEKGSIIGDKTLEYLKNLNLYVEIINSNLTDEVLHNVDIVIQTKIRSKLDSLNLNDRCRMHNTKYILAIVIGLTGYIFSDFGNKHIIKDKDGEKCKTAYITNMYKENDKIWIKLADDDNNFSSGDLFKILFNKEKDKIFKINDINNNLFWIKNDDTIDIENLKLHNNVLIQEEKEMLNISHRDLRSHINLKNYPDILINMDDKDVINIQKEIYNIIVDSKKLIDDNYYTQNIIKGKYEFPIIGSIISGIVGQEIIKITGKYIPLNQELFIDYTELYNKKTLYKSIKNKKRQDIYNLLQKDLLKKLENLNIFLVGCGALGCEYLKLFNMLNISTNKKGKITVTDMDRIELSNLNRQFLFRMEDIGNFKSTTAKNKVLQFNDNLNINDLTLAVERKTENYFNRKFWEKQDIIVNALDNVEARQYVDSKCLIYNKPLFEAGTLGIKCNTQCIIPNITKSYSETQDPVDKSIPLCTVKNFPFKIEHCIEWALEIFNIYFNETIADLFELSKGDEKFKEYISMIDNDSILNNKLQNIIDMEMILNNKDLNDIVKLCIKIYNKIFVNPIKQLLHTIPPDKINEDGSLFWSGNKLMPNILEFSDNKNSLAFITVFSKIMCRCLNIEFNNDKINNFNHKTSTNTNFVVSNNYHYRIDDKDATKEGDYNLDLKDTNKNLLDCLSKLNINKDIKFNIEIFDKDNDMNNHIEMICILSNIRANIYNIKEIDNLECKLIAGRIIPALSTTTTLVTGLSMMEIIKYLYNTLSENNKKLVYNDNFVNIGLNLYLQSQSQKTSKIISGTYHNLYGCKIKTVPEAFSNWDFIKIFRKKHNIDDINNLLNYLVNFYKINISMLVCENNILYDTFNKSINKNKKFFEIYKQLQINKSEYLILETSCYDNNIPLLTPKLMYCWDK